MKVTNWLKQVLEMSCIQDSWIIRDMGDNLYVLIHYDCDTIFFPSTNRCGYCKTTIPEHIILQLRLLNGK